MSAAAPTTTTTIARSLPAHALLFGGVASVVGAAIRWSEYALGFYGRAAEIVLLFVPLIAIILGVQRWRDGVLGGAIQFAQAFRAALAIGGVYALIQAGFAWILVHHLEPGLVEVIATYAREEMQTAGSPAEEIAAAEKSFREQFLPATFVQQVFSSTLVIAFIGSLLASLFVRKRVA